MWSMMNLLETSLRVPLIIKPPQSQQQRRSNIKVYTHPMELLVASLGLVSLRLVSNDHRSLPQSALMMHHLEVLSRGLCEVWRSLSFKCQPILILKDGSWKTMMGPANGNHGMENAESAAYSNYHSHHNMN